MCSNLDKEKAMTMYIQELEQVCHIYIYMYM